MPQPRQGFIDSLQQSRLNWISATAYPAVPAGVFLGLYAGALPGSDGTGAGNEITSAGRSAIAFGAPVSDGQQRWTCANTGIVNFTVPAGASPGTCFAFGIYAATTGGTPNYVDTFSPFPYAPGQVLSFPVGSIRLFSEKNVG